MHEPDSYYKLYLFAPNRTNAEESWEGPVFGGANVRKFGITEHFYNEDFQGVFLREYQKLKASPDSEEVGVYMDLPKMSQHTSNASEHFYFPPCPTSSVRDRSLGSTLQEFHAWINEQGIRYEPLKPIVHRLRLIKSPFEQAQMRMAAKITADAFETIKKTVQTKQQQSENDVHTLFEYECKRRGASRLAYVPVIAGSGERACIIHYTRNDSMLQ